MNAIYNLNASWLFKRAAVPFPLKSASDSMRIDNKEFYNIDYPTSQWELVSVPHCPNALESFDSLIRDAGEATLYRGFYFYRKTITLSSVENKKYFLEFEAIRQSCYLYVNECFAGYYEAGTAPIGFDITSFVQNGENLIAIATDNAAYRECEFTTVETIPGHTPGDLSGERFQWNQKDFNEVQGGITGNVNLYETGLIYQTLPLYNNLKTKGVYIYPSEFDFSKQSAVINVLSEIRNESGKEANVSLMVSIKDGDKTLLTFSSPETIIPPAKDKGVLHKTVVPSDAYDENPSPTNAETACVSYISLSERVSGLIFWDIDNPHLYDVHTTLIINGEAVDELVTVTGFREVTYSIETGLMINQKPRYLKGYAQRSTNEWAVIGVSNDWLADYDMHLVRKSNADFIRWMHVTPKPNAIRSGDKYGVVSVCPAGDKETDVEGRMWDMRVEAMRDAIIYFRNSPSVIFYEAGNNAISPSHMREMTKIKNELDPSGYRFMGCRTLTTREQIKEAEWAGTMVYRYDKDAKASMDALNKYIPMLETEYKRDESPRRVWDDYSPPYYDYKNKWLGEGARKTDGFDVWDQNQEEFAVFAASDRDGYAYFYNNRVGGITDNNYYSGAAIMVWSDSNMHGRNSGSENCRTTGKVDPVRIEKEAFHALRVMHSVSPSVYILGHWNYPPDIEENYNYAIKEWNGVYWQETDKTARRNPKDKTVFVIGSEDISEIKLFINGGFVSSQKPVDNYIYAFPHVDVTQSGVIKAVGFDEAGREIASHQIETAGEKKRISLTLFTGPDGLIADGSDVCFIDVCVTDEKGRVCPLAYDKITFTLSGDGVFLGGYNSGTYDSTSVIGKDYCFLECGKNRVFVKSKFMGTCFTLTARAEGLEDASVTVLLTPLILTDGMSTIPQRAEAKNTFTCKDSSVAAIKKKVVIHTKEDIYSVFVEGKKVDFTTSPYRPDSSTGVLCQIRPVLDSLGVKYKYEKTNKTVLAFSKIIISEGETAIICKDNTNLTNAEFYVDKGELTGEISAVLSYVDNISVVTDPIKKTVEIKEIGL